jgi:ABC-2 type transport system ATP-binding protein
MIKFDKLTKYYGEVCALKDVSFSVKKGEILGLLGPNGAGKTTAYRILTGYLEASGGTVKVKEHDIHHDLMAIKKMIGYLPESAPIYPDMIVYDYLQYVADIRQVPVKEREERIEELADLCSLRHVMHKTVEELSKGYRQRVGIAHALIGKPEILVLDEPTVGLDPNQIVETREIIKRIGKEKTIIYSTHILSEAELTCDRVVIINNGKVVADATVEALKQQTGLKSFEKIFSKLTKEN